MNNSISVVFCMEDDKRISSYVSKLKTFEKQTGAVFTIQMFKDTKKLMFSLVDEVYRVDLLFVDTMVGGDNGTDIVETLRERGFRGVVIFLTADDRQWEKAFDIQAFHYIVHQNCETKRFLWILSKAADKIEQRKQEVIAFTCAGERAVVKVKEIEYFEVRERFITVHYAAKSFEFYARMGKIEQNMLGRGFLRVHRSFLVSMDYVESIRFDRLTLSDGTEIPIGRGRYKEVKERFDAMERGDPM